MKILKGFGVFIAAFLFAWVIIFTFMQEPFKQVASARILAYRTPAIPIYFYVAGAFGAGLLLGLFFSLYCYISLQLKVRRTAGELQEVKKKLAEAQGSSERGETAYTADTYSAPVESLLADDADEAGGTDRQNIPGEEQ